MKEAILGFLSVVLGLPIAIVVIIYSFVFAFWFTMFLLKPLHKFFKK